MTNYLLEPEVAAGLGPRSEMERSDGRLVVTRLNYEFEDWLGDDLLGTFPCYMVTERLRDGLAASELTGFRFADVEVTVSGEFREWHPEPLPRFAWLQVVGVAGQDDMWTTDEGRLYVNDRALAQLRTFSLDNCLVHEAAA